MTVSNVVYQMRQLGFTEERDIYSNRTTFTNGSTSEKWAATKFSKIPDFHITAYVRANMTVSIYWRVSAKRRVKKIYNGRALMKFGDIEQLLDDFLNHAQSILTSSHQPDINNN